MLSASIGKLFCFSDTRGGEKNINKVGKKHIMTAEARCLICKGKIYPLPSASVVNCTKPSQKTGKRWNMVLLYGKLTITAHISRYILRLHFNHISGFCFTTNFNAYFKWKFIKGPALRVQGHLFMWHIYLNGNIPAVTGFCQRTSWMHDLIQNVKLCL